MIHALKKDGGVSMTQMVAWAYLDGNVVDLRVAKALKPCPNHLGTIGRN